MVNTENLVRAFVIKRYEKRDKVMLGKNKFMEKPKNLPYNNC